MKPLNETQLQFYLTYLSSGPFEAEAVEAVEAWAEVETAKFEVQHFLNEAFE